MIPGSLRPNIRCSLPSHRRKDLKHVQHFLPSSFPSRPTSPPRSYCIESMDRKAIRAPITSGEREKWGSILERRRKKKNWKAMGPPGQLFQFFFGFSMTQETSYNNLSSFFFPSFCLSALSPLLPPLFARVKCVSSGSGGRSIGDKDFSKKRKKKKKIWAVMAKKAYVHSFFASFLFLFVPFFPPWPFFRLKDHSVQQKTRLKHSTRKVHWKYEIEKKNRKFKNKKHHLNRNTVPEFWSFFSSFWQQKGKRKKELVLTVEILTMMRYK